MKRILRFTVTAVMLFILLPFPALAAELLIPVGQIIGLQLSDNTVTIAAFDDSLGSAPKDAGLKIGDVLLSIDGHPIRQAEDVRLALEQAEGTVEVTVRRGSKTQSITVHPQKTSQGPRLGVYLKQGITGIGTVTWYDPETGLFGTLGHGVSDSKGTLLNMTDGYAFDAEILSIKKGKCGEPGQLKGGAESLCICGSLLRNTPQGVFGTAKTGWKGHPMPVASYDEAEAGDATILSTVGGSTPRSYSVEILKIYPEDRSDHRNFLLKVTDPVLLETTGGIVQGMSGSPIIQDGKLIGAVTHVLVNDPTMGYGIFIENMLEAAG